MTAPISAQISSAAPRFGGVLPFVLGNLLLGTIGLFVHQAAADPWTATWFRCAFGLIGLTLWLVARRQTHSLRLTHAHGSWVLLAGVLMVAGWGLFFAAIERTSAGVAVVLFHLQPLWVLLLGAWWLHEAIGRRRLIAVGVAMLGLVLATGVLEPANSARPAGYWLGIVFCLLGSLCTAGVTLIARRLRSVPAGVLAWWQCALGAATLWVWPVLTGWPAWGISWLWLASLGLLHTGLAYTLLYAGMAHLRTERIAILQFLYPALALLLDAWVFDHRLGALQLAGIVVMTVAIGWAERPRSTPLSQGLGTWRRSKW